MRDIPVKVLRYLRVEPGSNAWQEALPLWEEAQTLAQTRTWQATLPVREFYQAFAPQAEQSADLTRTLSGCDRVELLAATIGEALEARGREYFSGGRPFAGFMLDRMGSFLAEAAMRGLHARVRARHAATGERVTRRYSPGYGDFSLEAQGHFQRLMGDSLPGLTLLPSFLFIPEKTVTAVCGVACAGHAG
ncbi:hypothetical protein [Fundidesulfovibrio terrae]|uniref:hypothetical protein n=1 Tax=Fundidesulfovibrio terrae TaxID=2922866 RepID=UPI001FB0043E|nr:hypothetical protein [Fundidesulfovibrio terrae]